MQTRGAAAALATLCLLATGCGGQEGGVTTLAPPTTTTTTTATLPTTTTTAPTTTTTTSVTTTTTMPATTTTTTLPPPVPVIGWEGEGIRELGVQVTFEYEPDAGLTRLVESALEAIGLTLAGDEAPARLSLELQGTPRSAVYGDAGTCFTGARVWGTMSLESPGLPSLRFDLDGDRPLAPLVIGGNCREDPEEAPFDWAFEPEFMAAVVEIWGPASVPYLTQILLDDLYLIRIRVEAVTAYRLMDPSAVPVEHQHDFMAAALWFAERTDYMGDDGEIVGYREAVHRMLLAYSETDFGFEDLGDMHEWQAWLAAWRAGQ